MDAIRFSVVVPVFNNADDLDLCLRSLRAQRYDASRFEIIVVDNGSTDASAAVARSHGVVCLAERQHQSSYAARNRGIERARGTFVAFTDSDCRVHPDWLREIERAAEGDTATGCFAGEILSVEPTTTVERFSDAIGLLRQKGPLSGWHFKPYAQTANAVYRRAVFDRIGLFDPAMRSGGDAAIAWRMQDETAFGLRFVPEAIVYRRPLSSTSDLWTRFENLGRGNLELTGAFLDYEPPALGELLAPLQEALTSHCATLAESASDERHVPSSLQALVRAAYLAGHAERAPRARLADDRRCGICGGRRFAPGPNGRLVGKRPPQCAECSSLERHRTLLRLKCFEGLAERPAACLVVGETIPLSVRKGLAPLAFTFDRGGGSGARPDATSFPTVIGLGLLRQADPEHVHRALERCVGRLEVGGALILHSARPNHEAKALLDLLRTCLPNAHITQETIEDEPSGSVETFFVARAVPCDRRTGSDDR